MVYMHPHDVNIVLICIMLVPTTVEMPLPVTWNWLPWKPSSVMSLVKMSGSVPRGLLYVSSFYKFWSRKELHCAGSCTLWYCSLHRLTEQLLVLRPGLHTVGMFPLSPPSLPLPFFPFFPPFSTLSPFPLTREML